MSSAPSDPAPSDPNESQPPEPSATAGSETTTPPQGPEGLPGRDIDEYRLIETIGEGGMGVIYKAEQRGAIRRIVALKVIKLGLDTKAVIARFEAERQALALMNHPNIARVFGAGSTPLGRPYFVMEYVPGDPITVYCDKHKLSIRQRLELFGQVCDAVQHAHTKGIIHRDLKATNVLVAEIDGKPVPKVIDFGVAKATNQRLTEETLFTQTGQLIGTPAYMSPEQAEGGDDVDTRTDVYALGVLLYELLTGSLPFDPMRLRAAAYRELQRIIREDDPPRPSTFYSTATEASRTAAARRAATVEELASALRSELEWIPLHAMRKEPGERYGTAAEFAKDIDNYLKGKPLIAAPDSRWYRLRKAAKRNKGPVAAAAAIVLSLLLGLAGTTWQMFEAQAAEGRAIDYATSATTAQQEALEQRGMAESRRVLAEKRLARQQAGMLFLREILKGINPEVARGRDVSYLLHLLENAEARLEKDLPDPADRAAYMSFLGDLYRRLNERERALPLLDRGVKLSRHVLSTAASDGSVADANYEVVRAHAQACSHYVDYLNQHQDYEGAVVLAQEAYDTVAKYLPADHQQWALREAELSAALANADREEEARPLLRSAIERMERLPEEFSDQQRAKCSVSLGYFYAQDGQAALEAGEEKEAADLFGAAEAEYLLAANLYQKSSAENTGAYARLMVNRAALAFRRGLYDDALTHVSAVAAIHDTLLEDPLHPDRRVEWDTRAKTLAKLERFSDAADAMMQAIRIAEELAPRPRRYLERSYGYLVEYLRSAGREEDADLWEQRGRQITEAPSSRAADLQPAQESKAQHPRADGQIVRTWRRLDDKPAQRGAFESE